MVLASGDLSLAIYLNGTNHRILFSTEDGKVHHVLEMFTIVPRPQNYKILDFENGYITIKEIEFAFIIIAKE